MSHRRLLCRVLILTTLLLASVAGYAQQQDVRLSPADPPIYTFPDSAKIQSAASIGNVTLVAWGTTVRGSDSIIRPALVMQTVQDGAAIGSPQQIHDSAGRPYRTVAVVGLDSLFLVLWNDARSGAPGIYARRVDRAGEFVGGETLLAPGRTMSANTSVWLHRSADGYVLYWAETSNGEIYHYSHQIDRDGMFGGMPVRLSTINFDNDLYYSQFPGARIDRDSLWFYHADGRRDPRRIPEGHLRRPHYLNGDTSVVVMIHDTAHRPVKLIFYRSLFDTAIDRSLVIKIALPGAWILNAAAVTRDTGGNYQIIFAVHRGYGSPGVSVVAEFYRTTLVADTLRADSTYFAQFFLGVSSYSPSVSNEVNVREDRYDGGDNHWSRLVVPYGTSRREGNKYTFRSDSVIVILDNHGNYPVRDSATERIKDGDLRVTVSLFRATRKGYSAMSVAHNADTVLLSVPLPPRFEYARHFSPGVSLLHDSLVVAYQKESDNPMFICGGMDFSRDTVAKLAPPLIVPPRTVSGSYVDRMSARLFHTSGESMLPLRGTKGYVDVNGVEHYSGGGVRVFVATGIGWRTVVQESSYYPPAAGACLYNPNDMQSLLSLYGGVAENILWGIDSADTLAWKLGVVPRFDNEVVTFIPDGYKSYLRVNGNNIQRVKYVSDSNSTTSTFTLRPSVDTVATRYQRLRGDRFLRIYPASPLVGGRLTDSLLQLEVYDLGGRLVDSAIVRASSSEYNFAVVEHQVYTPMVLLFGADDGVHLTLVDRSLKVLVLDTVISSSRVPATAPHGVFRGDTLYVVWEDYRDGGKDVYANRWVLPDEYRMSGITPAAVTDGSSPLHLSRITPNPATSTATLDLMLAQPAAVTIEFVDEMGRLVRSDDLGQMKAGESHVQVSVDDLHPGAYTVVVKSSGQSVTGRLIVLH